MRLEELSQQLKEMWAQSPSGERVATMHLFSIRYCNELADFKVRELSDLSEAAGGTRTYGTEMNKMVNLSKYVQEKG
jgi:hypothetical protein